MKDGWDEIPLGNVITHRKEFIQIDDAEKYKRCRVQVHAKGVVLRDVISGVDIKTKKQQVCNAHDFLVAEIDAKVGGFGVVPGHLQGAIVSSHYFLFTIDEQLLDYRFLDFYCRTPRFRDQVTAQGSTNYASIRPSHVLDYTILLPPLSEQRRIVAKIEELAEKIVEANALQTRINHAVKQLVPSYSYHLFAGELRSRASVVPLGDIAEIVSGVTLGRRLRGTLVELPYLRVANVQDGYLDLVHIKKVWVRADEEDKWQLSDGDLLLTEGGDWDKLGRGTVWRNEIDRCIHQNHIFRVRLDTSAFEPLYVLALVRSPYGKDYFKSASKKTTNLASINQRQLKAFPVYRVSLAKQRRIIECMHDLEGKAVDVERIHHKKESELKALIPSILDRAFKGEL